MFHFSIETLHLLILVANSDAHPISRAVIEKVQESAKQSCIYIYNCPFISITAVIAEKSVVKEVVPGAQRLKQPGQYASSLAVKSILPADLTKSFYFTVSRSFD